MRILVTGAAGLLGRAVASALQAAGHDVSALDRVRSGQATTARETPAIAWTVGDLLDPDTLRQAVRSQDAVFHAAAILAPASERNPERSKAVNVEGTRRLLGALGAEAARRGTAKGPWPAARPGLLYPSSVAIYGPGDPEGPPRGPEDPIRPSDHYTRQKAEAEGLVRTSGLPWIILRVGVVLHPGQIVTDPEILRWMFEVRPENRLEILHPSDAGRAVVHALGEPLAWQRVLPLGGGPSCQIRQRDLLLAAFEALGLPPLPPGIHGREPFYTDWLDTAECESLLRFQRYSFADFRRESQVRFRWLRPGLRPLGPLLLHALGAYLTAHRR